VKEDIIALGGHGVSSLWYGRPYQQEGIYVDNSSAIIFEKILSKLKERHPEHLRPCASVTISFIKDLKMAWNSVVGISNERDTSDRLARDVYERLTEEVIAQPMEAKTIGLICGIFDGIALEHFFEEDADAECSTSWQFNNRANSRSASGRYLEALEDYNYACELEPSCLMYLLNRARTFIRLDMRDLALRDALRAYALIENKQFDTKDDLMTIDDFVVIAELMITCGRKRMALETLLKFTLVLKHYLPFLSKTDDDGFCSMVSDGHSSTINIAFFLDQASNVIDSIKKYDECDGRILGEVFANLREIMQKSIGHPS
jgi:tetratricopeptide (TPR) repeat protein